MRPMGLGALEGGPSWLPLKCVPPLGVGAGKPTLSYQEQDAETGLSGLRQCESHTLCQRGCSGQTPDLGAPSALPPRQQLTMAWPAENWVGHARLL